MALRPALLIAQLLGVVFATNVMDYHPLDSAVCLNGEPAGVFVWSGGSASDWVIQLGGGSVDIGFCIDEAHCAMPATPPASPPPPPPPQPLMSGGPQSDDCTANPTFCGFCQAQIVICDFSLFLGDSVVTSNATTMHFSGPQILAAALKKLVDLGLSQSKRVLLTGVGHGGTALILNADSITTQLQALVPGVEVRALPADGFHPKHQHVFFQGVDFYSSLLQGMLNASGAHKHLNPSCLTKYPDTPWLCLYANESLPILKTPIFVVNQLASIWDTQCGIDGMGHPSDPVHP